MVLNDDEMRSIAELLLRNTREDRLAWCLEHGKVSVSLPNQTTVELGRNDQGPDFIISLKDDGGILIGEVKASVQSSEQNFSSVLSELYERALKRAGKSIFDEIVNVLKFTETAAVTVGSTLPPKVTEQQEAEVLKKMVGQWDLDYARGKERVTIRKDGAYLIAGNREPTFKLIVLAWNEEKGNAEVAKDYWVTGKRLQIEFLTISANTMVGHAKHDMHKLIYKRVDKLA